ncbi:MAG: histidinol dehydrogenase [Dehalococcoidia bacterium]|nr:histidinol dehydrogenase [Dehalococcoidia bacterium]
MNIKIINGLAKAKEEFSMRSQTLHGEDRHNNSTDISSPHQSVKQIVEDVRNFGDKALYKYRNSLDGLSSQPLEIDNSSITKAYNEIDPELVKALKLSANRIEEYHKATLPKSWFDDSMGLGEKAIPLKRAGVYTPGGTASYPSSVLMTAIPARVAGVKEIIVCTPSTSPEVLAAAAIAKVDRVFNVGGAQAIAAMTYGTESIPQVDIVCGPGNIYVTLAKKMVFGDVAVDGLYGPTEMVLIADDTANPIHCSADLLAQAEHDPLASPILVTNSMNLIEKVKVQLLKQIETLERRDTISASLDHKGRLVLVDDIEEAIELANFISPEHVCLSIHDPWSWTDKIRNAGGLFLGRYSPEVVGDYIAGPSHVMPTGGTARFSSALGVHQFIRTMPIINLKPDGFEKMVKAVSIIARSEGLTAHANAMEMRLLSEEASE